MIIVPLNGAEALLNDIKKIKQQRVRKKLIMLTMQLLVT